MSGRSAGKFYLPPLSLDWPAVRTDLDNLAATITERHPQVVLSAQGAAVVVRVGATSMQRHDVIHLFRCRHAAFLHAHAAQWFSPQPPLA